MGGPGGGTGAAGEGAQPIDGNRSSQSAVGSESSAADRLAVAAGSGGQGPAPGARTTPTGTTSALSLRTETGAYRRKPVIPFCGATPCCQPTDERHPFRRRASRKLLP